MLLLAFWIKNELYYFREIFNMAIQLFKFLSMKRILFLAFPLIIFSTTIHAGGIVTNTNQSAAYVRMLAKDAIIGVDGVYYNPAGLTLLGTGLHISINNQTISQNRRIKSNYPFLNSSDYSGKVSAPLFSSLYAAFTPKSVVYIIWIQPSWWRWWSKIRNWTTFISNMVFPIWSLACKRPDNLLPVIKPIFILKVNLFTGVPIRSGL